MGTDGLAGPAEAPCKRTRRRMPADGPGQVGELKALCGKGTRCLSWQHQRTEHVGTVPPVWCMSICMATTKNSRMFRVSVDPIQPLNPPSFRFRKRGRLCRSPPPAFAAYIPLPDDAFSETKTRAHSSWPTSTHVHDVKCRQGGKMGGFILGHWCGCLGVGTRMRWGARHLLEPEIDKTREPVVWSPSSGEERGRGTVMGGGPCNLPPARRNAARPGDGGLDGSGSVAVQCVGRYS